MLETQKTIEARIYQMKYTNNNEYTKEEWLAFLAELQGDIESDISTHEEEVQNAVLGSANG